MSFFWRCFVSLVNFSYWSKFHVNIITGSGIMTIFFYKGWPEIRKSEIPLSDFCPISGDWGELWIRNLAWLSLIECYWMLRNSKVTAFTVFELLREIQLGGIKLPPPPRPTQIRVKFIIIHYHISLKLLISSLFLAPGFLDKILVWSCYYAE